MGACNVACDNVYSLDADPDIAGIGVIISFLVSAWLTFFLALFGVLFVDNILGHLQVDVLTETDVWLRNCGLRFTSWLGKSSSDSWPRFLKWLKSLFLRAAEDRTRVHQVCLLFSDQQLIVGSALMITSLSKTCSITMYHYEIAANLAYCSVITYGCAEEIASGAPRGIKSRLWRLVWLTLLYASIFVSRVVWASKRWLSTFADPFVCAWKAVGKEDAYNSWSVALMVLFMYYDLITYFRSSIILIPEILQLRLVRGILEADTRLGQLPTVALLGLTKPPSPRQQRQSLFWIIESFSNICQACVRIMLLISITIREILWSMFASFAISFAFLLVLVIVIGSFRRVASHAMVGDENEWAFGQIMPMMLLVLPLTALVETLYPLTSVNHQVLISAPSGGTIESRSTSHPEGSTSSLDVPLERRNLIRRNQTLPSKTLHGATGLGAVFRNRAQTFNPISKPVLSIWDRADKYESEVINTPVFRVWLFLVVIVVAAAYAWYTGLPLEYV